MMSPAPSKLLFIINPGSGKNNTDWQKEIDLYFKESANDIEVFELPKPCEVNQIQKRIRKSAPDRVIAVGGDGTVKLVADCLKGSPIPLGILPGGSANGMARELNIPDTPQAAIDIAVNGVVKTIHLLKVNNELCIHLSDIGFNAFVVKKFEDENTRGMWGYTKAAWKVLWSHSKMDVEIKVGEEIIRRQAAMVVIANATKYGNGVVINPHGSLFDELFEVVIIKKISLSEIFKMRFTQGNLDPEKTEMLQTSSLRISSKSKTHFQVDGEYRGKLREVKADIIPAALKVVVPE